ncbi:MAG: 3-oxoacyl-[acyl-carrier-protein] synthase III C-terminal domain-containing protein [Acidobacteriota bacterium]|nr:3-oxoacyl-[acyl-carrier-protein] synthase III C-terminal domain-containing protein [Acidobacteriota bacterium]
MAFINAMTTAVPDHRIDQDGIREVGRRLLKGKVPFLEQALGIFTNAGVDQRYLVRPIDELLDNPDLGWRNDVYSRECLKLGGAMLRDLMDRTGIRADEIDMIITTSCTGFMIPAMDSYLISEFRMRPDTKRMPLTELGCAAGAMALSRAREYLTAFPDHKVVVMAVELPSLTVQMDDFRLANVVSSALFGDGGAAALLSGEPDACKLLHGQTHFFYDTPELMGFDLDAKGFRIILDKKISPLIQKNFREPVESFLAAQNKTPEDIDHHIFHPGGRRIMDSLKQVLNLDESHIEVSRRVLRQVGNLSSASILWVLHEKLKEQPQGLGLMAAFGPGFNAELLTCHFQRLA